MGFWQILYIVIVVLGLGISLERHGKRQGNHNSKHNFWATLIGSAILFTILYFGGFFS